VHNKKFLFEEECAQMELILAIVREVRRLKTEKQLSFKVPLQNLEIGIANRIDREKLEKQSVFIGTITNSSSVRMTSEHIPASVISEKNGVWSAQIAIVDNIQREN
jgi:valyl-tRNA synthetase